MKNRLRVTQSKNYRKKSTFSISCIDVNVKNKSIAESVLSKKRDLLSVQKYTMKFSSYDYCYLERVILKRKQDGERRVHHLHV